MASITKRLVFRVTTAAQRKACVFTDQLTARSHNSHVTPNVEWTIGSGVDGRFIWLRLLWTPVEPLEVQRPRGTPHDNFGDLLRNCSVHVDPRSSLGLKDFGRTPKAIPGMDTQLWLP